MVRKSPDRMAGARAPLGADAYVKITVQEIRFYYIFQAILKPENMSKKNCTGD